MLLIIRIKIVLKKLLLIYNNKINNRNLLNILNIVSINL